ncbi:MAG: thioredoxin [Dehalococcoidia bacterium]|nr:thioredoxin [Dehalococcoidia bacterium]
MNESFDQSQAGNSVRYELAITGEEARLGTRKILSRQGKRLEVNIPAGVTTGSTVKLSNALQLTDGHPGDILIQVQVREEKPPAGVTEINDGTFEAEVLKSSLPVVVDFWAPWCGPCRMIAPITEKLAQEYQGRLKFCKINIDQNRLAAEKYMVMSIPLLLFFKGGRVIEQSIGAVPESELRSKAESALREQ